MECILSNCDAINRVYLNTAQRAMNDSKQNTCPNTTVIEVLRMCSFISAVNSTVIVFDRFREILSLKYLGLKQEISLNFLYLKLPSRLEILVYV
jgi:hypothetical protein